MKIIIKSTNIKLTKALRGWVKTKLGSLMRFYDGFARKDVLSSGKEDERVDVFVEIGKTTTKQNKGEVFRAEAQIRLPGKSIRAEATRRNLSAAIVEARDKLQRKIKRYKEKRKTMFEKTARRVKKEKG